MDGGKKRHEKAEKAKKHTECLREKKNKKKNQASRPVKRKKR